MVVRIRFSMHGLRNNKFFHIVAVNSKDRRDVKPIETLGVYRHKVKDQTVKSVEWSVARIKYWLGVGAQPSKAAIRLFTQVRMISAALSDCKVKKYLSIVGRYLTTGFEVPSRPKETSSNIGTGIINSESDYI